MADTLTIENIKAAIKSLDAPIPDFIVSVYAQSPIEYQNTIWLSPDDAKKVHAKSPLILRQILSPTSGRYVIATPFDGPFPLELPVPPFELRGP